MVTATPRVVTRVSAARTTPGSRVTDRVDVAGTGALALVIEVELFGPFATRAGIRCTGAPLWTGTLSTEGDGTYTTEPVTLARVGYYSFRESVLESSTSAAFTRVVSVQTMGEAQLPTGIWSQRGHHQLVLVTCGGPFNTALGHYRDNVVVTAVPL